jgi:predicted ArsR family transcriptional regulator
MLEVDAGSVEGRILKILLELYPATWREVEKEVGVPPMAFRKAMIVLQRQGVVSVEGTGEKRFLTLTRTDILFHRSGGGKRPRKPVLPKHEYDGPMYG